jgi:hypothetical protein
VGNLFGSISNLKKDCVLKLHVILCISDGKFNCIQLYYDSVDAS